MRGAGGSAGTGQAATQPGARDSGLTYGGASERGPGEPGKPGLRWGTQRGGRDRRRRGPQGAGGRKRKRTLPQTIHSVIPSTRAFTVHIPWARQHVTHGTMATANSWAGVTDQGLGAPLNQTTADASISFGCVCPLLPGLRTAWERTLGGRPPHPGVAAPPGSGPSKLGIVFRGRSTVSGALAPIGSHTPGQGEGRSKLTSFLFSLLLSPTLARSMVFSFGLCPFLIASGLPLPLPLGVGGRT